MVHFAGTLKPWQLTYKPRDKELLGIFNTRSNIEKDFLLAWWKIVYENVWPMMKQQKVNISLCLFILSFVVFRVNIVPMNWEIPSQANNLNQI